MNCSACRKWLTSRVTDYENGERIFNFKAADGKGKCEVLDIETDAEFGCNKFEEGHEHIELMPKKSGSPWHHSTRITCPDCKGTGIINDGSCGRCCRTGTCLLYDDGYLGEERTRRHPKEATEGPAAQPTCPKCTRNTENTWVACPFCGQVLKSDDQPVRIEEFVP